MLSASARLASRRTPLARRALSTDVPAAAKPAAATTPATTTKQAPNYAASWSTNQRARPTAGEQPRFEQKIMELQPQPLSAMALIAEEPVRFVPGRKAVCDGGDGPLGHPKIFINLDKPGPKACGYCGLRYQQEHHVH